MKSWLRPAWYTAEIAVFAALATVPGDAFLRWLGLVSFASALVGAIKWGSRQ